MHFMAKCWRAIPSLIGITTRPSTCRSALNACRNSLWRPWSSRGRVALWFHDAVYDPRKTDHEAFSAHWAADAALSFGAALGQELP